MWALSACQSAKTRDERSYRYSTTSHPDCTTGIILSNVYLRRCVAMSQTLPTASSSSNFQTIFYASMKAYKKKTRKDLLEHPLMAQLQTCNSPTDILAVLRTQAQQFEQTTSADDQLMKWLTPTVNVLYAFSGVIGAGVGLVSSFQTILLRSFVRYRIPRYSHPRM